MNSATEAYILVIFANLIFALAIQVFAYYSKAISATWMNFFKACVAIFCFSAVVIFSGGTLDYSLKVIGLLVLSGVLGLAIGDLCLLAAFKELGPGRAMVLVAFHPLITGIMSYFFHGHEIDLEKFWAIIFMVACMVTFSLEAFKKKGNWYFGGIILALSGVALDALSMNMIKEVGDSCDITPFEGCTFRCIGAVAFFSIWTWFRPIKLWGNYKKQTIKAKVAILLASFFGTFVALSLIFRAIQLTKDNLATLASINISCSILASTFECIHQKVWPSKYLCVAFVFMLTGLYIFLK
jgi:drug/metabolite transporter (DMT)-like permease